MSATPPTAAQLETFFANVSQLRSLFGQVDVVFVGSNNTPAVTLHWDRGGLPLVTITVASDAVDDMNNALAAAYTQYQAEGTLRGQVAVAQARLASAQQQLDQLLGQ